MQSADMCHEASGSYLGTSYGNVLSLSQKWKLCIVRVLGQMAHFGQDLARDLNSSIELGLRTARAKLVDRSISEVS